MYLQIEYEIDAAIVPVSLGELKASASSMYLVEGSNIILRVPNKYYVIDETSSTMKERTMEEGYPKLSTDDENVKVFTFQFAKSKKVFYDPPITQLPLYKKTIWITKTFREKGWSLKISAKVVADWF